MQQKPELWRTTDYGLVKDLHLVKQRIAALESTYLPVQKLVDRAENEALVVDWKNYCLYYSATNGSLEVCQHLILYEKANPTVKLKFRNGYGIGGRQLHEDLHAWFFVDVLTIFGTFSVCLKDINNARLLDYILIVVKLLLTLLLGAAVPTC
jgi:hypothetical protein